MAIRKITPRSILSGALTENLNIDSGTLYVDTSANRVGVGTTSPAQALDVVGSIKSSALTSGRVTYAGASGLLSDSANLKFDGTNLGIGGTISSWNTFTGSLQIDGASLSGLGANNTALASNAYYQSAWKYYGTGSATLYQQNAGQHTWQYAGAGTAGNEITFSTAMLINGSGLVGIGTSSPGSPLTVSTTGVDRTVQINSTDGAGGYGAVLSLNNTGTGGREYNITSTSNADGGVGGGKLKFYDVTTATTRMMIDSSGNVGIGTSSPAQKLQISANEPKLRITSTAGSGKSWDISSGGNTTVTLGQFCIYDTATDVQRFNIISGTGQLLLDGSGNLGLGVTPSAWGGFKAYQVGVASLSCYDPNNDTRLSSNNYETLTGSKYIESDYASMFRQSQGQHQWFTAPSGTAGNAITFTQAMTLDASGNLLVGTTSQIGSAGSHNLVSTTNNWALLVRNSTATAGKYWVASPNASNTYYVTNNSGVGVYITDGATSWTGTSDERLKNITGEITNGLTKVNSLRAVEFTWKADVTNKNQVGLIAQDVQKVLPESISENNDGHLGIRYTEVIPLLVASIKEQQALIESLTTRLTVLENK
jgi:hypothetical protein